MATTKAIKYAPQCGDMIVESVLFKINNFMDPNPPVDDSEVHPLKEFIIKFTVKCDQTPLTLDYKTLCETKGLDYNNGQFACIIPLLRILLTFVIQVLGGNYSSTEQLNLIQQLLVFSLLTGTKIDIGEIIYYDLVTRLMAKSRQKYVSYPRFISCALEELLGYEFPQDKSFGFLPSILSKLNFSRNPYEVPLIELTAFMNEVINHETLVTPLPFSEKKGKKKSETVAKDNWIKHGEAAASYADLRGAVEVYVAENAEHKAQTDTALSHTKDLINTINKARVDERATILKSLNRVSETLEVDSTLKSSMQNLVESNTTNSGNITGLTELLRNANLLELLTQMNAFQTSLNALST
ncbi:hypothetical protein Tco_0262056 [Tanacetum coccineum]